ncbi:MAG TPA: hypothetical protein VGK67_21965 [Myxococcales bacterium]|jgi:hypothetical protein
MRHLARTTALAALLLVAACGGNPPGAADSGTAGSADGSQAGSPDGSVVAGDTGLPNPADAGEPPAGDTGPSTAEDAGTSASADAGADPNQLEHCYSRASFGSNTFTTDPNYVVDQDGYEYTVNEKADAPYAQMLSVALWPLSASTPLKGTFDLAQEPFDYSKCERCVLVIAGKTATDQKHYLAQQGTLAVSEVTAGTIAGTLANVRLAQVNIDETTLATSLVPGGCTLEIPVLSFSHGGGPVDPRIEKCFLPETFGSDAFADFVYDYEVNDSGWFYRAMDLPDAAGIPNLTLFVEVYREGTGSFPLAGAETNCPSCYHFVIVEAQAPSGVVKTYVSSGGTLVLTEMSATAMVGRLENVTLVETVLNGSTYTPVSGGCSTSIPSLAFDSKNATP